MKSKSAVLREKASADVDAAVDHYVEHAGAEVAGRFIDSLEAAFRLIEQNPGAGSPRWADLLAVPGLRSIRAKGFPWAAFYIERDSCFDVWRVLHTSQDIPQWMIEPGAT